MQEYERIERQMFDDALQHSRQGRNVVFDVLSIDTLARHILVRNFNGPLRSVLTYCPFHVLSSRMEQRNREARESGELGNQRVGAFPLIQFGEIYTKKQNEQRTLETVTRDQVTRAFNENFDQRIAQERQEGHSMPSNKEILIKKEGRCQKLLKKLGFTDNLDAVELAPRNQHLYDLILNSSRLMPTDSAQILHAGFCER